MKVMEIVEENHGAGHDHRDLETAAEVGRLMRMNYFSEEFIVYSTAYVKDGRVLFRMHEHAAPLYSFCETAAVSGLFPIPIERHARSAKVETGTRETARREIYQSVADFIRESVSSEVFELQKRYAQLNPDDSAYEILDQWRRSLVACFQLDRIQLFEGALAQALEAKHLSIHSYRELSTWSQERKEQIGIEASQGKQKTFSGFMYLSNGQWNCFSNAVSEIVSSRKDELQCQGHYCAPAVFMTYSLNENPSWRIPEWKQRFEKALAESLDEDCRARLNDLRSLDPRLEKKELDDLIDETTEGGKGKSTKILRRYGVRWGITH